MAENGKLGARATAAALASLARYRTLLDLKGITAIDVVATAAARDAANGPEFLQKIRALGLLPRLLSGEEEAVTSAHGVIGAFPAAVGIVREPVTTDDVGSFLVLEFTLGGKFFVLILAAVRLAAGPPHH